MAAARYFSAFNDTTAAVEQAIVWIAIIAAGMAILIPFGLLVAFASLGVALEDDTPWMSATHAAVLIFGPPTRRYIVWFGIVLALLVQLMIGVAALSRLAGAALHAPLLAPILVTAIGWPLGMMTLLFTVRVWRGADGAAGNGIVTATPIASWRIQAAAFAALCIVIYAIAHPHFGDLWFAQTPFSTAFAPVFNAPDFPSEATCLRETQVPFATQPFDIHCIKHQGFSFGW